MNEEKKIAGKTPVQCHFEEGKSYAWCACGHSANQPYCDGAHKKTSITPMVIKPAKTQSVWLCVCKQTKNPPYCDGSHKHC